MLRSSAALLRKGVVRVAADSLISDSPTVTTALSHGQLCTRTRPIRRSALGSVAAHGAATFSTAQFQSDSYFNSTQPEHPLPNTPADVLELERYLPPLIDAELVAQTDSQQALFTAIQHLDADLAWHLYKQLGKSRRTLSSSAIDLLITLQCRKPVRSSRVNVIDSRAAIRQVCDRVLQLCRDRLRHQPGSSVDVTASSSQDTGLSTLSASISLRLLYLLIVEEEQIASSKSLHSPRRRNNLSTLLQTLSANVDSCNEPQRPQIDFELRGRLAATLSRLGATDAAYRQLELVVEHATHTNHDTYIDPRPFDQLLSALARQRDRSVHAPNLLPSPVDSASNRIQENDPIIRALRLTLSSDVQASKANIHKCLQALDSATLWWLLPFELDADHLHVDSARELPDDRLPLKPKWHPWQASSDSTSVSQHSLDSFAERVALVLAQRGILQPSLHIIDGLHSSQQDQFATQSNTKIPDHDFFTVVLEKLAERMAVDSDLEARNSLDMHRGLSADLHLAIKVYTTANSIGVDLDSRLNEAVVKAMASSLPLSVADLGPERSRHTKAKSHIAKRNEQRGSKDALKQYLRRFTSMVLGSDPDLSKRSLSFPAQATLLGLHMRTRDYAFSKRLYQLMRIQDPDRQLWSSDPQTGAWPLRKSALHPLAAPDHDGFLWLFAQSFGSSAKLIFAVQLSLDWTAGGNTIPSSLNAVFVRRLLSADLIPVVRRVLQEIEGDRSLLPARLARSLVVSFADAGYPDLAMEMVANVSQLTASTYQLQSATLGGNEASGSGQMWVLSSTLKLMSIALDRSSRAAPSKDGDLQRKVLRLFDEFRLGMTHRLFMSAAQSDDAAQAHDPAGMTLRDVRMAYNACMRASLSVLSTPLRASEAGENDDADTSWSAVEATCLHVEELFKELKDLDVDPDTDSWDLRLTSSLHACLAAPDQATRKQWLKIALELLEAASEQVYKADGPLHASLPDRRPTRASTAASEGGNRQRVEVHPAVVAATIDACRRCSQLEFGLRAYEIHLRQSKVNVDVEKARLTLLADLAEPHEWRSALDNLKPHIKSSIRRDEHFVKDLQMLSDDALQRQEDNADPR